MTTTVEHIAKTMYREFAREPESCIEMAATHYEECLEEFSYPVLALTDKLVCLASELKQRVTEQPRKEQIYREMDKANKELKTAMQARANIQAALDGVNMLRSERIAQENLLRGL